MSLFWSVFSDPRVKIQEPRQVLIPGSLFLFLEKTSLCCFFFYFFQYVKERFASQIQEPRVKIQDIPVLVLDSCFLILARLGGE